MKLKSISRDRISQLPKNSGIYVFKKNGGFLYIGKATNIRERVKNHFPSRSEGERRSQKQVSSLVSPSARRTNVLRTPKRQRWGEKKIYLLRTPKRQRRGEKKIYLLRTQQPGDKNYLLLDKVKKIGYIETNSEIEALILEANLIKKYQPKYNVIWKDDKNYFFVAKTKEEFPRIFWTHQITSKLKIKNLKLKIDYVGPFVDGKALKQTLKILRKVFPYRSCKTLPNRPCLWYHLERCPAPCLIKTKLEEKILFEKIKKECQKNAKSVLEIIKGKKSQVIEELKKEMKELSKSRDFERAAKIRDQISALEKIFAHAKILEPQRKTVTEWNETEKKLSSLFGGNKKKISRIEAYDASNIQGQLATGSMITYIDGQPAKNFYRKFKISGKFIPHQKFGGRPNDIAMIKEILSRRLNHPEWPYPDLILIDGGIAQLSAALKCKMQNGKWKMIKVMALAKKKNELFIEGKKEPILLKNLTREIFNLILQLRDEAHRFAISYHKKLREKELLG